MQVDSLPAEPQGKTQYTGVSSLSLLQQIFLTQESNWGLLHCRWILYQLNYPGSPRPTIWLSTMKVKSESVSRSVMSNSLQPHGLWPTRLLCPQDFPGKNTRVDCHFLLQEIFLTQGSNLGLLHCRQTLYHLSHQGKLLLF